MPISQALSSAHNEKDVRSPKEISLSFSLPRDMFVEDPDKAFHVVPINLQKFQAYRRERQQAYTDYKEPKGQTGDFGSTARVFRNLAYSGGDMEVPALTYDESKDEFRVNMGNHRLQILESVYGFQTVPVVVRGQETAQKLYDIVGAKGDFFEPNGLGAVVTRKLNGDAKFSHDTDGLRVKNKDYDSLKREPQAPQVGEPLPQLTWSLLSRDTTRAKSVHQEPAGLI